MTSTAARPTRALGAGHALLGTGLLIWPVRSAALVARSRHAVPPPWMIRSLGARLLLQAAAEVVRPRPGVLSAGAGIDSLHAASMVPVLFGNRYRSTAAVSAGLAAASAGLSVWIARAGRRARS